MANSSSGVKGTVNLVLRGPDGKVKQHKTIRNKLMRQGLAHIVGRMIDPMQNGQAKLMSKTGQQGAETYNTAVTSPADDSTDYQHDIPNMMRFMGIGTGTRSNVGAVDGADASQKIAFGVTEGIEYRLQNEITVGTKDPISGDPLSGGNIGSKRMLEGLEAHQVDKRKEGTYQAGSPLANKPDDGRCDMGNNTLTTLIDATDSTQVATLVSQTGGSGTSLGALGLSAATGATGVGFHKDQMVRKIDPTNLFQGKESGQIVNSESMSTRFAEGQIESAGFGTPNDRTNDGTGSSGTGHLLVKPGDGTPHDSDVPLFPGKRTGMKLRFIALFPPFCPSDSNQAITEAGIFNHVNGNHNNGVRAEKGQTMLCRTTFAAVNKQAADSLQITWTIDFKDATN